MEISLTGAAARRAWHDVPVLYFQFVVVAAVFGGIAWVAAGRGGGITDAHQDRPDVALPDDRQLGKPDIDAVRFTVGWRGYRMDEVDKVLDRLAAEIDYRDRLIAELTTPAGPSFGAAAAYDPVARATDRSTFDSAGNVATTVAVTGGEPGTGAWAEPQSDERRAAESGEADDPEADDNPLSAWYRRTDPPA